MEDLGQLSNLFQKHNLQLLSVLTYPKRYVDLDYVCPNESTRTKKLRRLQECGLIDTMGLKTDGRIYIHYRLTEKGKEVLKLLTKLDEVTSN